MKISLCGAAVPCRRYGFASLLAVVALVCCAGVANAQQHISKRYPTGKNVRLELKNIQGTITVESWDRR